MGDGRVVIVGGSGVLMPNLQNQNPKMGVLPAIPRRALLRRGMMAAVGATALGVVGAGGAGLRPALEPASRVEAGGQVLNLVQGWNSVPWSGGPTPPVEAFAGLPLESAWLRENASKSWRVYRPGQPGNDLEQLTQGSALWVLLTSDAIWQQPPVPVAVPADVPLEVGWSFVSWLGAEATVWEVLGETTESPVANALRWNAPGQQFYSFRPGNSAEELFAILHPGDALWLQMEVGGVFWNPIRGLSSTPVAPELVAGTATWLSPSLQGNVMFCGGFYDRLNPTIVGATGWACGTRLRVWHQERTVVVTVQDTGLIPPTDVDLSEAAFAQLAPLGAGRIDVLIEQL